MTYPTQAPVITHQRPVWQPPVTGFILAILFPIVGIFICHSEKKQAVAIGQDNALARAGFVLSLIYLILIAAVIVIYVLIAIIAIAAIGSTAGSWTS